MLGGLLTRGLTQPLHVGDLVSTQPTTLGSGASTAAGGAMVESWPSPQTAPALKVTIGVPKQ